MQEQVKLEESKQPRRLQIGTRYLVQSRFQEYLALLPQDELKAGLDQSIDQYRAIHKQIRELEQRAYVAGKQMELIRKELDARGK